MTDRIKGLTVTLRPDLREDDAQAIISAIGLLQGVISVTTHVVDLNHHFAVDQARAELRAMLREVLR
jgi:hypothetical protein